MLGGTLGRAAKVYNGQDVKVEDESGPTAAKAVDAASFRQARYKVLELIAHACRFEFRHPPRTARLAQFGSQPAAFPTRVVLALAGSLVLTSLTTATETSVDYTRDIKPILKGRCYACHGALKQESGLRLDTAALLLQGGDSGPAVVAGKIDESLLIERVTEKDVESRMPPEGMPLTPQQIARIRVWIEQGAAVPEGEQAEQDPRDHWAFRKPVRAPLPHLTRLESGGHPIDAFLAARLEQRGLTPRPMASRPVLLRRLYLDLVGVPPTRDELHAFLADESDSAWITVVDRLLEDPRYGQRWARHWMDIWRYSDWYGRRHVPDVWNSAPQVWRWRDWIVESLNQDKGYDRMVAEMLAADEVDPENLNAGYATGYLVRNWYALNPNDWMRANVEHTGKAFLGLTFNCAHCHDHKYDPITHDDYFRLRAYFEPISVRQDRVPGEADPGPFQEYEYGKLRKIQRVGAVRIFDKNPDAPTWFYTGGDERNRMADRGSMPPGVPDFLTDAQPKIETVALPPRAYYPGLQPGIQQTVLNEAKNAVAAAESELAAVRQTPMVPAEADLQRLAEAEAAYRKAEQEAQQAGQPGALAGQQSLLLDATSGRRIVQNLAGVQKLAALPDGTRIEFQLQILADAHFNFQLAKDVVKALTAAYVGFDNGKILAYQPGGFNVFEAARYDFAAGQRRFQVTLELQPAADRGLLTVRTVADDQLLVDAVPVALNGWNPIGDPVKAITFDARTGCVAAIDEVTLTAPPKESEAVPESGSKANSETETATITASIAKGQRLLVYDFEAPAYAEGQDIVGVEGWASSSLSTAPATSVVSATALNTSLRQLWQQREAARRATEAVQLPLRAAEAKLAGARTYLASVETRIAADRARYGETAAADVAALARAAELAERQAAAEQADAKVLDSERALVKLELLPADAKDRDKQAAAGTAALAAARTAAQQARQKLTSTAPSEQYTPLSPSYPQTSTGRRRALARWIASRENPLSARVAVNHIWLRHFHAPLVSTVYDFGRNGAPPTHPELLDWLAVELMESGWSMKHLHRLIVTSAAWRRVTSPGDAEANVKDDPENQLLWRMNTGRMEAEVLRDSLLACAGQLDLTMGGQELENSEALTTFRRSLYYSVFPEDGGSSTLGQLFDAPNPLDCYRRTRTIVPQQALALTNSDLVHRLSARIVADWQTRTLGETQAPGDAEAQEQRFVVAVFERILSRAPTDAESQICLAALTRQRELLTKSQTAEPATRARESLVRALLNHNDFVTIR